MISLAPARPLPRLLARLVSRIRQFRDARATRRLLQTLAERDDSMLLDIGLRRHDVILALQMLDGRPQSGVPLSAEAALHYLARKAAERRAAGP
jgi:uncharacterized protein YjiS (DUF1127 family)